MDVDNPKRSKVNDLVQRWIGQEVWLEGTHPMQNSSGDVYYSPMMGTLREVLEDGFVVTPANDAKHEIVVFRENLRSIALVTKADKAKASSLLV